MNEQTTEQAARKPLGWHENDGEWEAHNTAGLIQPDGTPSMWYIGEIEGGRWYAEVSEFPEVPGEPDGFATMDEAKVWCEREDKALWAKARGRKPLEWIKEALNEYMAQNHFGMVNSSGTPMLWFISEIQKKDCAEYRVDGCFEMQDREKFPKTGFPPDFGTLECAKAWCEERDLELWRRGHGIREGAIMVGDTSAGCGGGTATSPAPEPFDIVRAVEKYIANAIEHAEAEEDVQTAKVMAQRSAVARLNIAALRMEQAKKQVKEKLEEAVEELDRLENEAAYEAKKAKNEPLLPGFDGKGAPTSKVSEAAPADEWRSIPLSSLPFKPGVQKAFAANTPMLVTLGALADWTAAPSRAHGGSNELKDLPGVGAKKAEEAEEVLLAFWRDHPEHGQAGGKADLRHDKPVEAPLEGAGAEKGIAGEGGIVHAPVPSIVPPATAAVIERSEWVLSHEENVAGMGFSVALRVDLYSDDVWGLYAAATVGDEKFEDSLPAVSAVKNDAITAGADQIHDWLKRLPAKSKRGEKANYVKAIVQELDKLDKSLAGQPGSADDANRQAVLDAQCAADDEAFRRERANQERRVASPVDADGKPARFKGVKAGAV